MNKGYFVTFEGIDGCGKSTQLKLLSEFLLNTKHQVITTYEPGNTDLGKTLREILLHYKGHLADRSELLLYLSDRAQHIETVVRPAIEEGKIVLCDRHTDSTLAYQGYGRGLDLNEINQLNKIATGGLKPDLTFLFDIDIETASKRVGKEKDRLESEKADFHMRVREGFLTLAKKEPQRIKIIDSKMKIEEIFEFIKKYVKEARIV